jgi:hypothetical protein
MRGRYCQHLSGPRCWLWSRLQRMPQGTHRPRQGTRKSGEARMGQKKTGGEPSGHTAGSHGLARERSGAGEVVLHPVHDRVMRLDVRIEQL